MRVDVARVGLLAGPALAVVTAALVPEAYTAPDGARVAVTDGGRATAGIAVWMAVWWMTEAIPVYATALVPLALFPVAGAASMRDAAAPYAHELIFLFLGGFVLALSMERWGLQRRIALLALQRVRGEPAQLVLAFMVLTALLSMWVSNTATAVMMLPIATSVLARVRAQLERGGAPGAPEGVANLGRCLMLGIAYGASIGGVGTLIGTPPNLFLASFARDHLGVELGFARWLVLGLPFVAGFLPLAWWLLTRRLFPLRLPPLAGLRDDTRRAYAALGPPSRGEWASLGVFSAAAFLWVTRPVLGLPLSDPGIAVLAALALFVLPVDWRARRFAMDWETAQRLPWGVLLLFGGGLSLAAAIEANGVGALLGSALAGSAALPVPLLVVAVAALVIALTELTSNTATTATLVPILAAVAPALGVEPLILVLPAVLAASCAFMLPVATPPNAVVFGSGHVAMRDMIQAGIWLNLIGVGWITGVVLLLGPLLAR